jgi:hypothetical protein
MAQCRASRSSRLAAVRVHRGVRADCFVGHRSSAHTQPDCEERFWLRVSYSNRWARKYVPAPRLWPASRFSFVRDRGWAPGTLVAREPVRSLPAAPCVWVRNGTTRRRYVSTHLHPQIDEQLRRYPLRRARCGWMDERVPPTASGRVCARTSGAALPCAPWDTHRHTTSSSQAWPHSSSIDKGPVPELSVPWATDSDLSPCFLSGRNKPLQYWVHGVLLHAGVRRPGRGHGGLLRRHGAARVLGDEARVFDRAVQPVDNFRGLNGPAYLMVASGSVWCVAVVFVLIAPLYTSRIRDSGCGPTGGPGRRPRLESRPRPRRNLGTGTYCGCFFFPFFSLVL